MIYSTLVKYIFKSLYGEPPDLTRIKDGEGWGLVLVADGVGGLDLCGTGLQYVMGAERLPFVVKIVPWGHGLGRWHADLTNPVNRDAGARKIVEEVTAFHDEHPGKPVHLIGKSGGTGVVVKALERLAADSVETVVLIAPALSPRYDLGKALAAVHNRMVGFWSPLDVIVLGAGTRLFGTIDRVHSVSAGLVGFRPPSPDRASSYAKLKQVRWRFSMARTGYFGGHVGPDLPSFLRKYVVPLLAAKSPQITDSPSSQAGQSGDR